MFGAKVNPWLEEELILLFETISNFGFGFPSKDNEFRALLI